MISLIYCHPIASKATGELKRWLPLLSWEAKV